MSTNLKSPSFYEAESHDQQESSSSSSSSSSSFSETEELSPQRTIIAVIQACFETFDKCRLLPELTKNDWYGSRLAELRFWSASVGAEADETASLDARLENSDESDVRTIVVQLLLLLDKYLELCIHHATRILSSDVPVSAADCADQSRHDHFPQLEFAMKDADEILEQLAHLAVAIRKSGTRFRLGKADQSFDARQYSSFRDHLLTLIYLDPIKVIEETRNQLVDGKETTSCIDRHIDPIQSRLIDNNLRRRHRFMYAQGRAVKLGLGQRIGLDQPGEGLTGPSVPQTITQQDTQHIEPPTTATPMIRPSGNAQLADATNIPSSASGVETKILPMVSQQANRSNKALTTISTTGSKLKLTYPKPPEPDKRGKTTFTCPACCLPQPNEIAEQETKWINHIAEDLSPYTCILSSCPAPNVTYVTRTAWHQHMQRDHCGPDTWECVLCPEVRFFFDLSIFKCHVLEDHKGAVNDVDKFVAAYQTYMPLTVESCPLCSWSETRTDTADPSPLMDHIAEHIHSFALQSLPFPPQDEPTTDRLPKGREQPSQSLDSTYVGAEVEYDPPVPSHKIIKSTGDRLDTERTLTVREDNLLAQDINLQIRRRSKMLLEGTNTTPAIIPTHTLQIESDEDDFSAEDVNIEIPQRSETTTDALATPATFRTTRMLNDSDEDTQCAPLGTSHPQSDKQPSSDNYDRTQIASLQASEPHEPDITRVEVSQPREQSPSVSASDRKKPSALKRMGRLLGCRQKIKPA